MTADGLHGIEVLTSVVGNDVSGDVRFELYEIRDSFVFPVRTLEILAEDVVRNASYGFEFAPIPDSKDRVYRLDLVASPAEGVALWATKGERYKDGSLHANGRDRWADLAFRVHAPVPSIGATLVALHRTNPVRAYLAIAALTAIWLLVGVVVHALTAAPPAPDRAASLPVA